MFGEGVDPAKMYVSRSGSDMFFVVGETGERIRVERWFYSAYGEGDRNQLSKVEFGDGTVWTPADINAMTYIIEGADGNDKLIGYDSKDILIGGKGDDRLEGGGGDDTYIWNLGDGNDVIYDYYGVNVLQLGEGVDPSKVHITCSGSDLYFVVEETGEKIGVNYWYSGAAFQLSEVRFADGTSWTKDDVNAMNSILTGTDGDDTINGYGTNDILIGGAGNDKLYGGYGDDVLIGGAGDDYLEGGYGNDTYIWNPGDGNDTIYDSKNRNYYSGVLEIGGDVDPANVQISRSGNNLLFRMDNDETVTVKDWYVSGDNQLNEVRFADGTIWSKAQINVMKAVTNGTDGDDTIAGFNTNDMLIGDAGNDTLYGYDGDDTLIGGAGDDYLDGGAGNDIYIWNSGDGNDTIYDYHNMTYDTGILKIGEGISPADVQVSRNGNDLLFLMETGETITVKEWHRPYSYSAYQLNEVQFADGTIWTQAQINATLLTFKGTDGDDTINGSGGNDILIGGAGNDRLYGEAGSDTLIGGAGDDYLEGGAGYDTYIWNPGDGNDTINDYKSMTYYTGTLKIGEGVDPADVLLTRNGNDMIFLMGNVERVTVQSWYQNQAYQLNEVQFADGTTWTQAQINAKLLTFQGTDGDDTINGSSGNDILIGGAGNDRLYGGAGSDTLIGGTGDDYLEGGAGYDTYIWNPGDGNDTINDYKGMTYYTGTLKVGEGINPLDVQLARSGNDMVFAMGTGEKVTVQNWYVYTEYQLTEMQFADSTVWTRQDMNQIAAGIKLSFRSLSENGSEGSAMTSNAGGDLNVTGDIPTPILHEFANSGNALSAAWRKSSVSSLLGDNCGMSRETLDLAVAGLQFEGSSGGQVCDIAPYAAGANATPYAVTTSPESGLKSYFSEENRKSA